MGIPATRRRDANGNIVTASDAVWWSLVTISTAGFGDYYPITLEGRLVAGILMVTGIGLFGTFTAFVAAWFVAPVDDEPDDEREFIVAELRSLRALIERERQPHRSQ